MKYPIDAYIQPTRLERAGYVIGRFIDLIGFLGIFAVGVAGFAFFADAIQ